MSMTKRDYEAMAAMIRRIIQRQRAVSPKNEAVARQLFAQFSAELSAHYPNFTQRLFNDAADIITRPEKEQTDA